MRKYLLVLALAICTIFFRLGLSVTDSPDEARIVDSARLLVDSGSFLVPVADGEPRLESPPLPTWFVAGSMRLLGDNRTAQRLPGFLLALLTALLTVRFAAEASDEEAGALAGLVLVTSCGFVWDGRSAGGDTALVLAVTGACYGFFQWLRGGHDLWVYAGAVAAALGFLSGGPIALVIPFLAGVVTLSFILFRKEYEGPSGARSLHLLPAVLAGAAIAVPWFVVTAREYPEAWQIWRTEFLAFADPEGDTLRELPAVLLNLLGGFLPWTLLLLVALGASARHREWFAKPELLFAACWFVAGLVFLHLPGVRRGAWLLLLYPPLAVLLGHFLSEVFRRQPLVTHTERWTFRIHAGLLVVAGLAFPAWLLAVFDSGTMIALATGVMILALGALAFDAIRQFNYRGIFYCVMLVGVVFFMVWYGYFEPIRAQQDVFEETRTTDNGQTAVTLAGDPGLQ